MSDSREPGADRMGPPDVREPTPAERVRALPLVSVALGSMAIGFCLVYFVCKPGATDRSTSSRPLASPDAAAPGTAVVRGSADQLRTDVDAAAVPALPPPADAGAPLPQPAPPPSPPPVPPPAEDAGAPPPASGLTLSRVEVRKCAGGDGIDLPRDRCGRVRGVELFMARAEATTRDCFEKSFADVPRPAQIGVTLDVDFPKAARRIFVPGADEARQQQFRAFKDCLEAGLGQPEYARIDHPLETYRFVFLYDYVP
ncbi:MAG: hypothetical protein HY905_07565 [Deltaproteobacteria bacterium]|nr:hypothetical protein [Deltaproteobacteria bacterium]